LPPESDTVELRVSTLTMSLPDGPAPLAGVDFVVGKAREIGVPLQVHGATSWYSTPGPPDSALHLWIAGMGAHVLIASLFVDPATPDDPNASRLFASLPPILASWRSISAA
jgi:hypothetical protein